MRRGNSHMDLCQWALFCSQEGNTTSKDNYRNANCLRVSERWQKLLCSPTYMTPLLTRLFLQPSKIFNPGQALPEHKNYSISLATSKSRSFPQSYALKQNNPTNKQIKNALWTCSCLKHQQKIFKI